LYINTTLFPYTTLFRSYIDQKAVFDGETYYRVNRNYGDRMQGWVKEENLSLYKMFSENNHKKTYELSSRSGHLLSDPWGTKEQRSEEHTSELQSRFDIV